MPTPSAAPPTNAEPKARWCKRISKQERRARERIRNTAIQMRADLGLEPDERLAKT